MPDILLGLDGDIKISSNADISLTTSVRQAVLIRLRWIYREWRLGPELGFPWFEDVFIKNPNTVLIKQLIREQIMQVDGVSSAEVDMVKYDRASRSATFSFTCRIGEDTLKEEVTLYECLRSDK